MSRGVLIFAFNNTKLNYFKQATWVADRVEKFLGLPTTIVTDEASVSETKHNVVFKKAMALSLRNYDAFKEDQIDYWYNVNRFQSFDVSPYDETIVIDSDYIVNSDQLNLLFDSPYDFLCHRAVYDVANKAGLNAYQMFGTTPFPHYWATVLFFRKSDHSKFMFNLIAMIKDNYQLYSKVYGFSLSPFRNDYAVSIALSIAHGHRLDSIPSIPWLLPTATTDINVTQINDTEFELRYEKWSRNKQRKMQSVIKGQDFHCLNKVAMERLIDAD